MGDPRVNSTPSFVDPAMREVIVDVLMSEVLNNPKMGENAKEKELEKIFSGMSDPDKQALYDRLKDRKSSDPLAKEFHYRLSHGQNGTVEKALKALNPNHGVGTLGQAMAEAIKGIKGPNPGKAQALDNKAFEKILQKGLEKEEPKTDFGPEIHQWTKDIIKTPAEKAEIIQKRLAKASPDDLKKIMAESDKWPKESRDIVNQAMRQSPAVMARIAKEFPADKQMETLHRALQVPNNFVNSKAFKAWMDNVSSEGLNAVMFQAQGQDEAFLKMKISQQINSSDLSVFNKLDPRLKMIALTAEHSNENKNTDAIAHAFGQLEPDEKNQIFDYMQKVNPNALPDFMKDVGPHVNNRMLRGLNKENAEFLRETYSFLAKNAKTDDLKELYANNARFLKGWMEEAFKTQ